MISPLTSPEVMCELAVLDALTTAQIALVASCGITNANKLKRKIIEWAAEEKGIILFNTFYIPTDLVFEYLHKDINKYKGEC